MYFEKFKLCLKGVFRYLERLSNKYNLYLNIVKVREGSFVFFFFLDVGLVYVWVWKIMIGMGVWESFCC